MWELISDIILGLSILTLAVFACLGLYQWIKRKSLKKVDRELLWMPLPLVLTAVTYFVFDKLIILATRPNGSGEPSFPSSHVMAVATIFFLTIIVLPKYVKSQAAQIAIEIFIIIAISLTCLGRVFSGMHSLYDVVGGIIFAFVYSEIYYLIIKRRLKNVKHLHKNHKK